jgi:hypothetical protein
MSEFWRRSSFCQDGSCVVVKRMGGFVQFGSDEDGLDYVYVTIEEWNDFVKGVKNGEFDFE